MTSYGINIDPGTVESNIIYFGFNHNKLSAFDLQDRLQAISENEPVQTRVIVRTLAYSSTVIRVVLHHQISSDEVQTVLTKLNYVLNEAS